MDERQLSLQEVQAYLYGLLCNAADYFEEKNIEYFLCGGTLLGAIRHNGFIPWDDDIDIFVPRKDYEKLKKLVQAGDYKHDYYQFKLPGDSGYGYPFIKMADKRIITIDKGKNPAFNMDLNIDVFPFDNMPDNALMHKYIYFKNRVHRAVIATELVQDDLNINKAELIIAKTLCRFWGRIEKVCLRTDKYNCRMNKRYSGSINAGNGPWQESIKDYYKKEWIYPLQKAVFENREFNIPNDYDAFLTHFYGDYMTPPPEGQRARHYFKAYWK